MRLTNCPGALTKCQNAKWNRRDFRSFLKSIGVSSELNAGNNSQWNNNDAIIPSNNQNIIASILS